MAGLVLCEPTELYNILNQVTKLSRLTEPNYLCLLDVRSKWEYDESHVITALRVKKKANEYLFPESLDLECVKYCVVYDNNTMSLEVILKQDGKDVDENPDGSEQDDKLGYRSFLDAAGRREALGSETKDFVTQSNKNSENVITNLHCYPEFFSGLMLGTALECGTALTRCTRHPIHILKGGYQLFSAMYHFFRTQKIIWMPQELDAFQPYPVEIIPGKLYLGDFRQACDPKIQKDLKIKAHVNVCMETTPFFQGDADKLLHIPIEDSQEANISPFLRHLCHFIDIHLELGSVILVFSTLGISRGCTAIIAYLMHSREETLKRSWAHVKKCKSNMRPNRKLVVQLSQWEQIVLGDFATDISDPLY